MSNNHDDQKIAGYFSQLRQAELGQAPEFSKLLEAHVDNRPRHGLQRPLAGLAVAVLTLSILTVILLRPDTDGSESDYLNTPMHPADTIQLSSVGEMPTDFLLETPWSQLASLDPGDQLLDLPHEFLEELPDEL